MNTAANTLSAEYLAAIAAHDEAQAAYDVAVKAFRARAIGDDEYLKARAALKVADAAFDVAFAAEQARGE